MILLCVVGFKLRRLYLKSNDDHQSNQREMLDIKDIITSDLRDLSQEAQQRLQKAEKREQALIDKIKHKQRGITEAFNTQVETIELLSNNAKEGLSDTVSHIETLVHDLQNEMKKASQLVQFFRTEASPDQAITKFHQAKYKHAANLIGKNISVSRIKETCNISEGEIQLMSRLSNLKSPTTSAMVKKQRPKPKPQA